MTETSISYTNVLIVDDDPIMASVTEGFLNHNGVESVRIAADGKDALEVLDSDPAIDFIFCDLNMPNMDGLQFLRHLAERSFAGDIGIVSGEDDTIIKSAAILGSKYGLRIRGTLTKPIDLDKIIALLTVAAPVADPAAAAGPSVITRSDLVFALVNRNIKPFFQPKICTTTGQLRSAEALARWIHPVHGIIPPSRFIPLAEDEGLIDAVTGVILRESLAALAQWLPAHPDMKMAANLSGDILTNVDLPELLIDLCSGAGVDPAHVVLEITESRVLTDSALPVEILARLRMKRFELSVDDFGTGYSNIDRLREYPLSELKIDQTFIRNAHNDTFAEKCVLASVDLGRALGLRLVAEGVETEADYAYVRDLGIDEIQGYYFSRPLSFEDFTARYIDKPAEAVA